MRILIDLCHPADVHFFRAVSQKLNDEGHDVVYTARDKDVVLPLCNELEMPYHTVGTHYSTLIGKGWELLSRSGKLSRIARKMKIDVLAGFGNPYVVIAGVLCRKPSFFINDTENAGITNLIGLQAKATLTTNWFGPLHGKKHTQGKWFKEMAYIENLSKDYSLSKKKYLLIRKVAWTANHDLSHSGLDSLEFIKRNMGEIEVYLIKENSRSDNKNTRLFHKLLAQATVVISEGATSAAEAVFLGRPTIYVNTQKPGYIKELEKEGMLQFAPNSENATYMAAKHLETNELPSKKLDTLKDGCIDVVEETIKLITELHY